jgi:predicted CXXCH cytochrome family protein
LILLFLSKTREQNVNFKLFISGGMGMRKLFLIASGLLLVFSGTSMAFHDAGVAQCGGCHTMHNSEDGALVDPNSPDGNDWLLIDETPSDVCLSCHGTSHGSVFVSDPLAPPRLIGAGNFTYLLEDNLNDGHGGGDTLDDGSWVDPIPGDAAGHNINAPSMGVGPDGTLSTAPGGTFPASQLGCSSCHDPHGNTNFRLLYGQGRTVQDGLYTFVNNAPVATGLGIFGGAPEGNANHTAYNSGMSGWCGNCHGDYHNNNTQLIHPSGSAIGGTIANTYNLYNGTEDQLGGLQTSAYLAAVPFEDGANTTTSTAGPNGSGRVMCLTCHRAERWSLGFQCNPAGRGWCGIRFICNSGSICQPQSAVTL